MLAYAIAIIVGVVSSLLMTLCWRAIADGARWRSTLYEAGSIAVGIVAWQLWATSGDDWVILAAEGFGTVVGTWMAMR